MREVRLPGPWSSSWRRRRASAMGPSSARRDFEIKPTLAGIGAARCDRRGRWTNPRFCSSAVSSAPARPRRSRASRRDSAAKGFAWGSSPTIRRSTSSTRARCAKTAIPWRRSRGPVFVVSSTTSAAARRPARRRGPRRIVGRARGELHRSRGHGAPPLRQRSADLYAVGPYSVLVDPARARRIVVERENGGFSEKVALTSTESNSRRPISFCLNKVDAIRAAEREALLGALAGGFPRRASSRCRRRPARDSIVGFRACAAPGSRGEPRDRGGLRHVRRRRG